MLEKILEEIEEATRQEDAPIYCGNMEVDGYVRMSRVEAIIRQHMNDGWIPTEERLPTKEDVYDVTVINGKGESVVCTWQFLAGKHLSGSQTYVDGVHYWADNYRCDPINEYLSKNVIAWRKRPEPYRPEKGAECESD